MKRIQAILFALGWILLTMTVAEAQVTGTKGNEVSILPSNKNKAQKKVDKSYSSSKKAKEDGANKSTAGKKFHYGLKRAPHGHNWVWSKRKEYTSMGINLTSMAYFGDITPKPDFLSTDIRMLRPSIHVFYSKRVRPNTTMTIQAGYGRIAGYDEKSADPTNHHDFFRYIRGLHFRSDIFDVLGLVSFDLIKAKKNNVTYYKRPNQIIPFVTLGIGAFYNNPKAVFPDEFGGGWNALQPIGTEGQGHSGIDSLSFGGKYSKIQLALPLGFGFRKKLSPRVDIAFEMLWRFTSTDYMDDVSKSYLNKEVFGDDELAYALHDRSLENGRYGQLATMVTNGELYSIPSFYVYPDGTKTLVGYGNDQFPDNIRGNVKDRDVYLTTGLKLIYIFPPEGVFCPIKFK